MADNTSTTNEVAVSWLHVTSNANLGGILVEQILVEQILVEELIR